MEPPFKHHFTIIRQVEIVEARPRFARYFLGDLGDKMPGRAAPAVSPQGAGAFLVAMACCAIPVSGTVSAADLALRIAAKAAAKPRARHHVTGACCRIEASTPAAERGIP
jgi:hypothetical protein